MESSQPVVFDSNASFSTPPRNTAVDAAHWNDGREEKLMCSVLNVVIDHTMEDITPMETEEWQQMQKHRKDNEACSKPTLKVPVLRVFGPVARHTAPLQQPIQSACLYIHGAFPYLLARPVVAGPDGSLLGASPNCATNIDWDNPDDVVRIQDNIKVILENTLQAMDTMRFGEERNGNNKNTQQQQRNVSNTSNHHPIIRKVSVVEGRGFYTFCPGPSAPFLRVEYYEPKLRWKVKLVLEKGLEVPQRFHPDPRQYDRVPLPGVGNDIVAEEIVEDVLKFHCYEAHIPYTMQFFKDHNLAGMAYIHLRKGRIRGSLPHSYSIKAKQHRIRSRNGAIEDSQADVDESVFLQSNTPQNWMWPKSSMSEIETPSAATSKVQPPLHQPTREGTRSCVTAAVREDSSTTTKGGTEDFDAILESLVSDPHFLPPARGTSCDVELDCTVLDIQNVDSILRSMPSAQEERDMIQWRAVPSLQEIWREERARMNKLLSPELTQVVMQEVLSQDPSPIKGAAAESASSAAPPFTLNVKENAPRSGARLAVEGMWSLVDVTAGLKQDFLRCLSDILERHRKAVEEVDRKLLQQSIKGSSIRTNDLKLRRLKLTPPTPSGKDSASSHSQSTPTMAEALQALESIGSSTPGTSQEEIRKKSISGLSPSIEETIDILDSIAEATPGSQCDRDVPHMHSPKHLERLMAEVDSPFANHEDRKLASQDTQRDACDKLSREENLPGRLSYESGEEVNSSPKLSTPPVDALELSQRIDRCESVFEVQDCNLEDLIDPETLAPFEEIELHADHCRVIFAIESENDSSLLNRVCGFRAATCRREGHSAALRRANPGIYKSVTNGGVIDGLLFHACKDEEADDADLDFESLERFCQQSQKDTEAITEQTNAREVHFRDLFATQAKECVFSEDVSCEEESGSGSLSDDEQTTVPEKLDSSRAWNGLSREKHAIAPTRAQVIARDKGQSLHRLVKHSNPPDWLAHASSYMKLKLERTTYNASSSHAVTDQGRREYMQPVSIAPSRDTVERWTRKRSLVKTSGDLKLPVLKRSKTTNQIISSRAFEIDSNSRKLIAIPSRNSSDHASTFSQGVEEVTWDLSQTTQMTQTPMSQEAKGFEKHHLNGLSTKSQEDSNDALQGIGAQGGRIHVEGGGGLKAKTRITQPELSGTNGDFPTDRQAMKSFATPITAMSVEVHVQCREGVSRLDSKKISMALDSNKDGIVAILYCFARDPGGGNCIEILQRGCICTSLEGENPGKDSAMNRKIQSELERSMPRSSMGVVSPLSLEVVRDERHVLRRFKDIVIYKDPDMMLSWDTQGAGIGYVIERGIALGKSHHVSPELSGRKFGGMDMVKLLGRTPLDKRISDTESSVVKDKGATSLLGNNDPEHQFKGSGLGSEWDERVGAGAAAASIIGRLVFAGWKIVAEEVKHGNASYLPAIVAAVLNKRIPHHDEMTLTRWYSSRTERWRVLNHRLTQATATLLLFDALDIVGRAGEAARLSGVEFSQSFPGIRGSQYKVEGVLLRALQSLRSDERGSKSGKRARSGLPNAFSPFSTMSTESVSQTQSPWKVRRRQQLEQIRLRRNLEDRQYFFFSPSLDDTNRQEALEVQALTLEPVSGHYTDPVVVCDFTALYPSLVIAYNLCYSTCAGKLEYHCTRREMQIEGRTRGRVGPIVYPERRTATILKHHFKSAVQGPQNLDFSRDRGYISPSGTIYLSEGVLKGVLPQVLDEILTTRAMLKRAAQEYKKNVKNLSHAILRQLEARQLALKYVANVTYGYTSATFSGRCAMPLLADSIVECGRRTLRNAINLANRWGQGIDPWGKKDSCWLGATVVYGDTDSLFVKMPGRSYKEAFQFGEMLCRAVTSLNPPPVQLKLEKVYVGCIMQTMKRYGGMKYESKDQKRPTFEAKGLETIRRDQCALTQKVLRNALITLFKNGVESVKEYLCRQWSLIIAGNIPVSDFILTGRVRSKYRGGREGPVQAVLARRLGEADPGRIVRHKERLPYVIVATPGVTFRLKDCVLTPLELLERWDAYKIHSGYYIERHVNAALQRCLGLAPHFVKVDEWYQACPKPRRRTHFWPVKSKRSMITAYFGNDICSLCDNKCQADGSSLVVICRDCRRDRRRSVQIAASLLNEVEKKTNEVANECSKCNGCFESAETFALVQRTKTDSKDKKAMSNFFVQPKRQKIKESLLLPLANCICIDCPRTFQRHRLRERGIEAQSVLDALTW